MKLYKIYYQIGCGSFLDMQQKEDFSFGNSPKEAIENLKANKDINVKAKDFIAIEFSEIFGHKIIVER